MINYILGQNLQEPLRRFLTKYTFDGPHGIRYQWCMYLFAQFRRVSSLFLNLLKISFDSLFLLACFNTLLHLLYTYISIGKRFYGRNRYLACIETEKFGWEIDQVQRSAVSLYWLLVSLASHNRFKSFLNSANCLIQTQELWTRPMRYPLIQPEACKHEYISWKKKKKNAPSEMI